MAKNPKLTSESGDKRDYEVDKNSGFKYIRPAPLKGSELADKLNGPSYRDKSILAIVYRPDKDRYDVSIG